MDPITQQTLLAAAGAGGDKVYVDDVFSTFVYDGNSSTQVINNGIDLSGEGGLVWVKPTNVAYSHSLVDTERGSSKTLSTNSGDSQYTNNQLSSFNSNGFTLNSGGNVNGTYRYASWTFRKAPGFFDVVTWTGNDTPRTIAHNLGTVPGMIMVKRTNSANDWAVYHRSLGNTHFLYLSNTYASGTYAGGWNNTTPTSTHFTVGDGAMVNSGSDTFVAYVFAHDAAQFGTAGNESIIKCGYLTTGSGGVAEVNLGFEPQWLLVKTATEAGAWYLTDSIRGFVTYGPTGTNSLFANSANAEGGSSNWGPTSTGFKLSYGGSSGIGMIYMAIRRPHKPPESATEVFEPVVYTGNGVQSQPRKINVGFAPDTVFGRQAQSSGTEWFDRLRGINYYLSTFRATASGSNYYFVGSFLSDGYEVEDNWNTSNPAPNHHSVIRRAPGFYDVVTYDGTGSVANHAHNLGVVPELMIVKCLTATENWRVYAAPLGAGKALQINGTGGVSSTSSLYWNNTAPTSSVFTVPNYDGVNGSGKKYVNYMFATLSGISKVGSYTGTGNTINVDCGFTNGARYIIIKRDGTGDWYQFSTSLGISNGNDPHYFFNVSSYVTGTDYIDPLAAGFTVTSSAPAGLNASGSTYIFLAIA